MLGTNAPLSYLLIKVKICRNPKKPISDTDTDTEQDWVFQWKHHQRLYCTLIVAIYLTIVEQFFYYKIFYM